MALDHTKDYYYSFPSHSVTDLTQASASDFITRWITHYCAPGFIFLAGTSAFLSGTRRTKGELSAFLLKRGIWLIIVEIFIINLAWRLNPAYNHITFGVLWCIGICMVLMAVVIYLPFEAILVFGLLLVFGHNTLDNISVENSNNIVKYLWSFLHEKRYVVVSDSQTISILYPIVPWIGLMALGYCIGRLFVSDFRQKVRFKYLLIIGGASIVLFFVFRVTDYYGDSQHLIDTGRGAIYNFLELLNCTKYPPSLCYILMTMGPLLILLVAIEALNVKSSVLIVFGRVPFFFYSIHIFVIHLSAILLATIGDYNWDEMGWATLPADFGFNLGSTYVAWFIIVSVLFIPCYFFNNFKRNNPDKKWLSYF